MIQATKLQGDASRLVHRTSCTDCDTRHRWLGGSALSPLTLGFAWPSCFRRFPEILLGAWRHDHRLLPYRSNQPAQPLIMAKLFKDLQPKFLTCRP